MKYRITASYSREFETAPRVAKGEVVHFEKLDPKNRHWFFGRDSRGATGFFPIGWFEVDGSTAIASRDYDAAELTVSIGSEVTIIERYGGWILVENSGGKGWIPEESIK